MTTIQYECKGNDGTNTFVNTLPQAKDFVAEHGGSYEIRYTTTLSTSEGFARKGHRVGGKQTSVR